MEEHAQSPTMSIPRRNPPSESGKDGVNQSLRYRSSRTPRVRACVECKRHKIRCDVRRGSEACERCLRTGNSCELPETAQKALENDAAWKAEATAQISQLQAAVKSLLQREKLPDLSSFDANASDHKAITSPTESVPGNLSATESIIAPIDPRDQASEHQQDGPGLVQAPMSNLYELTKASTPHKSAMSSRLADSAENDLISRGIVSEAQGEQLLALWLKSHNRLLWGGVIFPYNTLSGLRKASVLLSTAILTIAALHMPGQTETLQKCYDAFVILVSNSSLSRNHNLDDVRGLCLGAFYLPNLSWRLSGHATRIAAEMNLHQSFHKLMNGDTRHAERARVWFVLFICDRQLSIAYGRPSAFCDDAAVRAVERFVDSPSYLAGDTRISSHTALFRTLSEVYQIYGNDPNQMVSEADLGKLRMFNIAIDQWRMAWQPQSFDAPGIGTYPSQSVVLYYHFARFQVNSIAFRGLRWPSNEVLGSNRREAAMAAISAAMSTLVHISAEPDIRDALCGVPLFTHTMVAFCATFLLKMAVIWTRGGDILSQALGLGFNIDEVISLARKSADLLSEVADNLSEKHVTRLIVAGIRELLQRATLQQGLSVSSGSPSNTLNKGVDAAMQNFQNGGAAVEDFATQQMGGGAQEMVYNMDVDSLAALLEYGTDETFLGHGASNDFDWANLG